MQHNKKKKKMKRKIKKNHKTTPAQKQQHRISQLSLTLVLVSNELLNSEQSQSWKPTRYTIVASSSSIGIPQRLFPPTRHGPANTGLPKPIWTSTTEHVSPNMPQPGKEKIRPRTDYAYTLPWKRPSQKNGKRSDIWYHMTITPLPRTFMQNSFNTSIPSEPRANNHPNRMPNGPSFVSHAHRLNSSTDGTMIRVLYSRF